MEDKKNKFIKKLYYDPEQGFQNADKLFAKIKNDNELNITKADITRFIKSQVIDQVYKKVNGPKKYNSYRAWYPSHIFQIDIVNYQRHEYKGDAYILTLIDVYSRYACARAMPNRKMETIIKNYNSIMEEMGPPYILQADNEFNKKEFLDVLKKDDVKSNFFQANEVNHNAVVERFNYTLTNFLKKIRTLTKNKNWVSYLQKAIHNYNNSIHSTTKNTPYDVYNDPDIGNEQKYVTVENPFKINDAVKIILKKRKIFDKGDTIKNSVTTYKVIKVQGNKIYINGMTRFYKPYELTKINDIDNIVNDDLNVISTQTNKNKQDRYFKREGIDKSLIITSKRNR
jgi:hypothetical protein